MWAYCSSCSTALLLQDSVGIKGAVTAETLRIKSVFEAFIVCIERKNEVFCSYSTDSVGCCVLH